MKHNSWWQIVYGVNAIKSLPRQKMSFFAKLIHGAIFKFETILMRNLSSTGDRDLNLAFGL